jgi:hypothetical protein
MVLLVPGSFNQVLPDSRSWKTKSPDLNRGGLSGCESNSSSDNVVPEFRQGSGRAPAGLRQGSCNLEWNCDASTAGVWSIVFRTIAAGPEYNTSRGRGSLEYNMLDNSRGTYNTSRGRSALTIFWTVVSVCRNIGYNINENPSSVWRSRTKAWIRRAKFSRQRESYF